MIADENAAELNGWVFGCDICQDVCPWNRKAPPRRMAELDARPEWTDPDLLEWLSRDALEWKSKLKGSAQARTKRSGLLRNAVLVLGSRGIRSAATLLAARLDDPDEDASVRASAAWALGQIDSTDAEAALARHHDDPDVLVLDAVRRARARK